MKHDFDEIINRKNTNSVKHDFFAESGKPEDAVPLWVADMDFKTAPYIVEKLQEAVSTGIYGYTKYKSAGVYFNAVASWFNKYHDWDIEEEWLVKTPGVVVALALAIRAFSQLGEGVLIQRPVYHPFTGVVEENNRKVVNNPLVLVDGHYEIDFDDFEAKIVKEKVKVFLLCSPHNPVGRVWHEWELRRMGEICLKHNVVVVSDEIHQDLVLGDNKHIVFSNVDQEFRKISVICTAPSKTFNLAALQNSNIIIANKDLRNKFIAELSKSAYNETNIFGLVATIAAYEGGHEWYGQLIEYLEGNLECVKQRFREQIPQVNIIEPEGTFLVWLDFGGFGLTRSEREQIIVHKAKLWFDPGIKFGAEGKDFERMNIASPRSVLVDAIDMLAQAFEEENI